MNHNGDDPVLTLADLSQIIDSPLLRAMSGELVDADTHTDLVAIAAYEEGLCLSA